MSLVDYGSTSEDEDAEVREKDDEEEEVKVEEDPKNDPLLPVLDSHNQRSISSSNRHSHSASQSSTTAIERLPDASLLLNSPAFSSQMSGNDHSSRVAAAMAESASRKRESNGSAPYPRSKFPRGNLPHSRNVPETVGGLLVPPQLKGRSNVVTEDISKLFVRRHAEPSSH